MVRLSEFYKDNASDQWFSTNYGKLSVHDDLRNRGYDVIEQNELDTLHSDLTAPFGIVDLPFKDSIPVPLKEFSNAFLSGRAFDLNQAQYFQRKISDLLTEWMTTLSGGNNYLVSLFPSTYLVAKSKSITFDDVFMVTRTWGIDCFIGVFNESNTAMFIFSQEFGWANVSFKQSCAPPELRGLANEFRQKLDDDIVRLHWDYMGGERSRHQAYYQNAIEPFV